MQLFWLHVSTPMSHLQALIFKNYQYILSYSFLSYSNYCNRDPFMHYKTSANVYMVLVGGVGSCFGVRYCSYLGGGGVSRVRKSSGCTHLRL